MFNFFKKNFDKAEKKSSTEQINALLSRIYVDKMDLLYHAGTDLKSLPKFRNFIVTNWKHGKANVLLSNYLVFIANQYPQQKSEIETSIRQYLEIYEKKLQRGEEVKKEAKRPQMEKAAEYLAGKLENENSAQALLTFIENEIPSKDRDIYYKNTIFKQDIDRSDASQWYLRVRSRLLLSGSNKAAKWLDSRIIAYLKQKHRLVEVVDKAG